MPASCQHGVLFFSFLLSFLLAPDGPLVQGQDAELACHGVGEEEEVGPASAGGGEELDLQVEAGAGEKVQIAEPALPEQWKAAPALGHLAAPAQHDLQADQLPGLPCADDRFPGSGRGSQENDILVGDGFQKDLLCLVSPSYRNRAFLSIDSG